MNTPTESAVQESELLDAAITFDSFLNEPLRPDYTENPAVREYRLEAYRQWEKLLRILIASQGSSVSAPQPPSTKDAPDIPMVLCPTGRTIPDLTKREHVCEWQNTIMPKDAPAPAQDGVEEGWL